MIPTQNTAGHQRLHAFLNEMGLICEDEVPVGKYTLDIYVRDLHLGFEYDGPTHRGWKSEARDKTRDAWLRDTAGIPLLRVTETTFRDQALEGAIIFFVTLHSADIEARRAKWLVL